MMAIMFSKYTTSMVRHLSDRHVLVLIAILGLGVVMRFCALNDHYFYIQDSTIQISGAKNIVRHGDYPYEHYGSPGAAIALLPFLVFFDFSLTSAQVGVAFYSVVLILLSWVIVKRVSPSSHIAPHLAALFVATNPALIAGSRVMMFDIIQTLLIVAYFLVVTGHSCKSPRSTTIAISYALAALLVLMNVRNLVTVAFGTAYFLGQPWVERASSSERRRQWLLVTLSLLAFVLFTAFHPWFFSEVTRRILAELRSQLKLSWILPNLRALLGTFGNPLYPPATAVALASDIPHRTSWEWLVLVSVSVTLAIGLLRALRQQPWKSAALLVLVIGLTIAYLPYSGWQMRYYYPVLLASLCFVSLGIETLIQASSIPSRRVRPVLAGALTMSLVGVIISASLSLRSDADMLEAWDTEDSLRLNGVHLFPADTEAISGILDHHPNAGVVSSMSSFIDIIDGNDREILDLYKLGIESGNSDQSVEELERQMDRMLESGRDILYIPTWYEIDDPWLEKGFRKYFDFITSHYSAYPEYIGVNEYRRVASQFAGRAYVQVYVIPEVSISGSVQEGEATSTSKWIYVNWIDHDLTYDGFTLVFPLEGTRLYWVRMDGTIAKFMELPWHIQTAQQLDNGHILVQTQGEGMHEIDGDGSIVWSLSPGGHHDAVRSPQGTTFVLQKEYSADWGLQYDVIAEVDQEKNVKWRWSSLEHLDPRIDRCIHCSDLGGDPGGDWLHSNALDLFPDGDVLISLRNLNRIARIDYTTGTIVWSWGEGILGKQHASKILENGNILLFDNSIHRTDEENCSQDQCSSRVLEIDPATREIVWEFGPLPVSPAFGDADRLPNGNTLVTIGFPAQVWEVTPEGKVVWKLWSLDRAFVPYFRGGREINFLYRAQRVRVLP